MVARGLGLIAALVGCATFLSSAATADPDRQDIGTLSSAEITTLQQRLTDAGCYSGPLDGQASAATKSAVMACPDQRPQLRIETGMHVGPITHLDVDEGCKLAATSSIDKTVRLWSLPDLRLLKVLRGPISAGDGGKSYATAISPDNRFVAAGGWDASFEVSPGNAITIFDAKTGAVVKRLSKAPNVILQLAFSPDGHWLAATYANSAGLRVYDASTWYLATDDKAYRGDSYGLAFGPDGRLYTVAQDGKLRRYGPGPEFKRQLVAPTPGGRYPFSVSVDPAGERIVVGFHDKPTADIYNAATLRPIVRVDTKAIDNGNIHSMAWNDDGHTILAGGRMQMGEDTPIITFDRDGHTLMAPKPLAHDSILGVRRCGKGFAVGSAEPAFGLVDLTGSKVAWRNGVSADMREKRGADFTIALDARAVRFGLGHAGTAPVLLDLRQATLVQSPTSPAAFIPAIVTGLPLTDWFNTTQPRLSGQALGFRPFETLRSAAIRPDLSGFVLGTEYLLRAYNAYGALRWQMASPSATWGVNMSADGKIVVAAYGDGTIRWHRWSDGQELLAVFVDKDTKAWVAWTPTGYYTASPGGEDMIGWHVNRGWAQAADFFPASKFRDTFYRPDIVEKVLDTLDEAAAVKQANAGRPGRAVAAAPITNRLPPIVSIVSPGDGGRVGDSVKIDYLVRSPSNLEVDAVEVLVDGRPISTSRGLERTSEETEMRTCLVATRGLGRLDAAQQQGCHGSVNVHFPDGASEIGLIAHAGDRTSEIARVKLVRDVAAADAAKAKAKPRLYAVVIGVSTYAKSDYALGFAAKDAQDFAKALQNQKGASYSDVDVRVMTDAQATRRDVQGSFDWLSKHVTAGDVGLVYMAGHGVLDERGRFYFLAADSDADDLRATAIPRDDISDVLSALTGKALLFLDACHSGAIAAKADKPRVDINGLVNDMTSADHGVVTFAASTGRQVSQENASWGNGAFTKAVVEGLGLPGQPGKAVFAGASDITTSALDAYVSHRVAELTDGQQSPVMIRPPTVPDFSLALAR